MYVAMHADLDGYQEYKEKVDALEGEEVQKEMMSLYQMGQKDFNENMVELGH